MIKITNTRTNGGDESIWSHTASLLDAAISLIYYEFGYGGKIISSSQKSLTVQTRVFAAVDTVIFSGPEDLIQKLREAAGAYCHLCASTNEKDIEECFSWWQKSGLSNGFLCWASPIIVGGVMGNRKRLFFIIASMFVEDESLLKIIVENSLHVSDLKAFIEFVLEGAGVAELESI